MHSCVTLGGDAVDGAVRASGESERFVEGEHSWKDIKILLRRVGVQIQGEMKERDISGLSVHPSRG